MNPNYNDKKDFHILLSSDDSSSESFTNNNMNNFTNLLVHPVFTMKHMKCALLSYTFFNTVNNYEDRKDSIMIFDFLFENPNKKYGKLYKLRMRSGYYESPEKFESSLNEAVKQCKIKRLNGKQIFSYDHINQKFSISQLKNNYLSILVRGFSISILGLGIKKENDSEHFVILGMSKLRSYYYYNHEKRYFSLRKRWKSDSAFGGQAPYVPVLSSLDTLTVECNMLTPYIFGNNYCQILKTFEVDRDEKSIGRYIVKEFNFPVYHEIKNESIRFIQITSKDSYGKFVKFSQGKVIVHLHFVES